MNKGQHGKTTKEPGSRVTGEISSGNFGDVLQLSAKPLYLQVKESLLNRVVSGEWKPGAILPSETELAREYNLSQGTIRKAVAGMADDGIVTRHAGKGTFVTSHHSDQHNPERFRRFYTKSGRRLSGDDARYISCASIKAPKHVAAGLNIEQGSKVTEIIRTRYIEQNPVLLETIYLNHDICPGAEVVFEETKPAPIYLALEQAYQILILSIDEKLISRMPSTNERKRLNIAKGVPVLEVQRQAFSIDRRQVEFRVSVCAGNGNICYWNHYQ